MDDWGLTLSAPFEPAAISWVAPARLPDGTPAVLKVNFPEPESEHEADALQFWDGDGAVRLLAQDRARRALLIARCEPGAQLRHVSDETAANRIAAGILRRLWKPAPSDAGYRTLADEAQRWAQELPRRWERHGRQFPRALLDEAVALGAELGSSQPDLVVCHLDLASLLRDRRHALFAGPHPQRVVSERLDLLCSELDVDRERARGWALVHPLAWGMDEEAVRPDLIEAARLFAAV